MLRDMPILSNEMWCSTYPPRALAPQTQTQPTSTQPKMPQPIPDWNETDSTRPYSFPWNQLKDRTRERQYHWQTPNEKSYFMEYFNMDINFK